MLTLDNMRLVDGNGNVDSSWHVEPPATPDSLRWSFALLAEYQREEPASGWHLQTRGDFSDWHNWQA